MFYSHRETPLIVSTGGGLYYKRKQKVIPIVLTLIYYLSITPMPFDQIDKLIDKGNMSVLFHLGLIGL